MFWHGGFVKYFYHFKVIWRFTWWHDTSLKACLWEYKVTLVAFIQLSTVFESHTGCTSLTFLHCAFSNVSSNCLPLKMQSHIFQLSPCLKTIWWYLFTVRFQISSQIACLCEWKVTLVAFIKFSPCLKVTLVALLWRFSTVHFQMSPQIACLWKCKVTFFNFPHVWKRFDDIYSLCVFKYLLKLPASVNEKSHWLHLLNFPHVWKSHLHLTFLHCAFTNVSSKWQPGLMQSHTGHTCLIFLHCAF